MRNKDIIVLALPRFDGKYESTSFNISYELAKNNRVVFVDNPFTLKDVVRSIRSYQFKKRWRKFLPFSDGLIPFENHGVKLNIQVLPPILPINPLPKGFVYNALSQFNHWLIARRIKKAIRRLKMKDYIFINSWNFYYPDMVQKLKPSLSVYHCVDAMIKPYSLRHGPYLEPRAIRNADFVVSTSKALQEEKAKYNINSYFIPNAANFMHSSKALDRETEIPRVLSSLKKPIIGYIGNIERRIDYDLMKQVLEKNPDWTLALIGPVDQNYFPGWFEKMKNVVVLGPQPYQQLPGFLKGFDVAIIPFKVDHVSRTIFPLKLFEYLGAGKPVVTTPFNPDAIEALENVLYVASDAGEFERSIKNALGEKSESIIEKRIAVARENSWENRGKAFADLLENWLHTKESGNGNNKHNKTKSQSEKVHAYAAVSSTT